MMRLVHSEPLKFISYTPVKVYYSTPVLCIFGEIWWGFKSRMLNLPSVCLSPFVQPATCFTACNACC